jgi:signal transduction histidine kinase
MEQLILDLLALSRIGREARAATAVSLAEVVDDVVADLAGPIRERAIQLARGELPTIWGVRTQVEQVMGNLVGNAVKYLGDTSQGRVEVGALDRGSFVECTVRDNGIGIDPAYHERIFEVFQRLKDVDVEGTGVGLAIVKRIVQASGGQIWVESAKGQGATFHFTWPKGPASEPQS